MTKQVNKRMSILMVVLMVFQLFLPAVNQAAMAETISTMLPPSNLSVQMVTPDDIKLTWSAVFGASGYNVYEITEGQLVQVGTSKTTSYAINDLPEGSYRYVVSTLNGTDESGPCAPVTVDISYPTMAAPANLKSSIQNGNDVQLSWGAAQYAEGYNIYELKADGEKLLVSSATGTSGKVVNVAEGTYQYAVSAINAKYGESELSNPVQLEVVYPTMTAPTTFTYTLSNANDATLRWGAVTYATGYRLYQLVNGEKLAKGTVTGTSVTYTNLSAGEYSYEIHAYSDRFGESVDSKQLSFTITEDAVSMTPPTNFAYRVQNGNDIVLTWTAATNATNYNIYRVSDGQKVLDRTVTGISTIYTNMPAGDYSFELRANSDRFGESEGSQLAFTLEPVVMAAPPNAAYKIQNINDVVLSWGAVPYAANYKVYQVIDGEKVLKSTVTGTSVTNAKLPAGDYVYEVHSVATRFGESVEGSQIAFTVGSAEMVPPANLTHTIRNGNDIVLSWDAAANATSYKVFQIIDGQQVLKSTVTGTTVAYNNLPAGDYTYEVYSVSTRFGQSAEGSSIAIKLEHPVMAPPTNLVQKLLSATKFSLTWDASLYATSYKVYQVIGGEKVLKSTVTSPTVTYANMAPGDYTYEVHSVSTRFGESMEGTVLTVTLNGQTMEEPINPTYTITSGNDITLKWTGVPYANGYKVYQLVNGEKTLISTVTTLSVKYTNMPEGDYEYIVHSYSNLLGESPEGVTLKFTLTWPEMAAPASLTYTVKNGNDVVLTWPAVPFATDYNVYEVVAGQEVLLTSVKTLTTTVSKVPNGDHTYVVRSSSTRFGESAIGAQVTVTLNVIIMQPPTDLTYSITKGNDITLRWTASTYATSYNVYQIINGEKVLKSSVTTTAATYANMPAGDYVFEVQAVSTRFGESPEAARIAFTLEQVIMQAPENLTHTITTGNDITLKWNASTYATSYKVYQLVNGERVLKSTVTSTSVKYSNMPEGKYSYEVTAFSTRFGESPQASAIDFELVWPVVVAPALTATVFNANNITFTWPTAPWANEYRLYEVRDNQRQLLYKGTALTYKIYNLTEETHYYEITAYSTRFGESAPSEQVVEKIVYPIMQPPKANLTLLSTTSARISWDFVVYANGYNIYEVVDGQPILLAKNVNNLSYTLNDLVYADHQYYVTSYSNSFGESEPSEIVIAKLIIDTEAPVTTANAPTNWTNQTPITVTLSATDNETGVVGTYYAINDSEFVAGTSIVLEHEGITTVSFYSVDKVGNTEQVQTIEVKVDQTAPVTVASDVPEWSKEAVTVTLSATDDQSGVAKTLYSVDGSAYVEGTQIAIAAEGVHQVSFYSVDVAGNVEVAKTIEVKVDKTAPVTVASDVPEWSKEAVTVTLSATDAQSGVAKTLYSVDGSEYVEGTEIVIAAEGVHQVSFYSVDVAGNVEAAQTIEVKVDKTTPVTVASDVPEWSKEAVTVTLSATDAQSGVAKTLYSVDGSEYVEGTEIAIAAEGVHQVSFYSVDVAGNVEVAQTIEVKVDKTAPVTVASDVPEWSKEAVTVTLSAIDAQSGVAKTLYSVDGSEYVEGTEIAIAAEGVHQVSFYSVDVAGNVEVAQTIEVKVDKTAPVTVASDVPEWSKEAVTVTLSATDAQSGVAKTLYSVDGSEYVEGTEIAIAAEGVHQVSFYSVDVAGNVEVAQTIEVKIDKTAPEVAMELQGEYKLGATVQLSYVAKDNLSGITNEQMTVYGPNDTTGKVAVNGSSLLLSKPGSYKVVVTVTDGVGLSATIEKQLTVFIPATIEVTPKVMKANKGLFTVRVNLPKGYSTKGFDLKTATLNGVKALATNNGYLNQAKQGQFKFERSDFTWTPSTVTVTFRGYVDGNLVVGQTTVIVQKGNYGDDDHDKRDGYKDDHDGEDDHDEEEDHKGRRD